MLIDRLKGWFGGGRDGGGDGGNADGPCPDSGPEMISCQDALARLQEFVDGELTDLTHDQVESHFEVCTRCYPHLAMEESFKARVHAALARPEVPEGLRGRVLEMLRDDTGA